MQGFLPPLTNRIMIQGNQTTNHPPMGEYDNDHGNPSSITTLIKKSGASSRATNKIMPNAGLLQTPLDKELDDMLIKVA